MKKIVYVFIIILHALVIQAYAENAFIVRKIVFQGLHRLSQATARTYVPIQLNTRCTSENETMILKALYKTNFFQTIALSRKNNALIITVVEYPIIGQLTITGNSIIASDKLKSVMKSVGIVAGRVYQPAKLEKIKQSLLNEYYRLGHYNVTVDVSVHPLSRDRVSLLMKISEGLSVKIRQIHIIGSQAFSESTLTHAMALETSGWLTFFTQSDHYSEEKFEAGLENLRNFYFDHGFLRFVIKSSQAEITPDHKAINIVIVVDEGKQYKVKNYAVSDQMILSRAALLGAIHIQPGDIFSRQAVLTSEHAITKLFGEKGYLFAMVHIMPTVDDQKAEVSLWFNIDPGQRIYVRYITFSNNKRTNDAVLRQALSQFEASPVSSLQLDQSVQRLNLLPYIRDVQMQVQPVPNQDQQVDVNYQVQEDSAAQASFHIGYSQLYHTILGVGLNHQNFFGTGNAVGLNLSHSRYEQFYGFDYTNPYYTLDGISRSISVSVSKVDPKGGGLDNAYTTHEYDASVLYGIPVLETQGVFSRLHVGLGYQNTIVRLASVGVSNQINDFINKHGRHFQELDAKIGFSRNSLDKTIFPTRGVSQSLFLDLYLPLSHHSLSFYTFNYNARYYYPLIKDFIFISRADLGYGNGWKGLEEFPFFRNYYAGGLNSIRGYQGNSLGPADSNGQSFGGNVLVDGSVGLVVPNHFSENLRTSIFLDAGNVYSTRDNRHFGGQSTNSGPLRYSVGIEADFLTPFGPVSLSLAEPIHQRRGDAREVFQFALGANF